MSVYYHVYAEANVGGKWYSLSPYFKISSDSPKTGAIFWAQSAFWEVGNELQRHAHWGIPDDMSEGLRELFHENLDEPVSSWNGKATWRDHYNHYLYYVNFAHAIVSRVNRDRPFMYEGYVTKKELAAFECYELEEFSEWLTEDEYAALTDRQKRQYVFHRWNDPYGEYWIYSELARTIWTLCNLFQRIFDYDIQEMWDGIDDSQVRVYVLTS